MRERCHRCVCCYTVVCHTPLSLLGIEQAAHLLSHTAHTNICQIANIWGREVKKHLSSWKGWQKSSPCQTYVELTLTCPPPITTIRTTRRRTLIQNLSERSIKPTCSVDNHCLFWCLFGHLPNVQVSRNLRRRKRKHVNVKFFRSRSSS